MNFNMELKGFQIEATEAMKDMEHVLLYDDMGLGKTIMSIYHTLEENLFPCLILCPKSVKNHWYDTLKEVIPNNLDEFVDSEVIPPTVFFADGVDEIVDYYFRIQPELLLDNPEFSAVKYFILQHDALAHLESDPVRELITKIMWKSVIVDECHRFRNSASLRTLALMRFHKDTKFLFLTGTPIVNDAMDLFFSLHMIYERLPNVVEFQSHHIKRTGNSKSFCSFVSSSSNQEKLDDMLGPFYIRREKADVLDELPKKTETLVYLEMTKEQKLVYDHFEEMLCLVKDDGKALEARYMFAILIRLRQISLDPSILGKTSSSSKTNAIMEMMRNTDEKWIIASTSKVYSNFLIKLLSKEFPQYRTVGLTGDTEVKMRLANIAALKNDPNTRFMVMTMQTGGLGLNLQFVHNLLLTDLWWNPAMTRQTIDRIYRIGQNEDANIYILQNNNSIDNMLLDVNMTKAALSNLVIRKDLSVKPDENLQLEALFAETIDMVVEESEKDVENVEMSDEDVEDSVSSFEYESESAVMKKLVDEIYKRRRG